ncbi:MAG: radical SAM family heme chaperone HemW [Myxococcales bacterium]
MELPQTAASFPAGGPGGLGVYVHFPYCRSICPYCDFAVERSRDIPHARYARAVERELSLRAPEFAPLGPARSVFFGGGTPSLWDPAAVRGLLERIEAVFDLVPGAEVTLEANPEDRSADRLAALREAGVTRISWGVQSFEDGVLRRLGRRHRGDDGAHAVEASVAAGFPAVSVDLIYGAAGQDAASAAADARRAASLGVQHASAYALTLDELAIEVPMARVVRKGRLRVPDADAQAELGRAMREALGAGGLARYEVSNYAREPWARSVHNLGYWEGRPYLGLGAGASGATPLRRYANARGAAGYLAALEEGRLPAGEGDPLDDGVRFRERVMLGSRLVDGLDLGELEASFGREPVARLREEAGRLPGLVEIGGGRLRLTERGLDLHSEVALRLC